MSKLANIAIGTIAAASLGGVLFFESLAVAGASQTPGPRTPVILPNDVPPVAVDVNQARQVIKPAIGSKALASLVWTITETVAKYHDKPCPREAMIAAGMEALYLAAKTKSPDDLATRSSHVSAADQLTEMLDAVLQKNPAAAQAKLENAFLYALLASIPGKADLVQQPSKKELAVEEQISANRYVGIGIALMYLKDECPKVTATILHGAARKAGMKAGDAIESVDGNATKGVPLVQVIEWLRGPEGSSIKVVVRAPDAAASRTYTMIRDKVPFEHVYGFRRISDEKFDFRVDSEAPIAYVRIGNLSSSSLHELRQFERKIRAGGFRAIVLDLRGNRGGSLQHAALLCGGLLDGNLMWSVRQQRGAAIQEFHADHECLFRDWPMAVLIDKDLGSAASLIAAALHDSGRAELVGEPTNLDGFVKSVIELPGQKESLILATGRVERAKAGQVWPLQPDYLVGQDIKVHTELTKWTHQQETTDETIDPNAKAPADPQLAKAIKILRSELAKAAVSKKS
jgi:carboxyl-terminal processing protease